MGDSHLLAELTKIDELFTQYAKAPNKVRKHLYKARTYYLAGKLAEAHYELTCFNKLIEQPEGIKHVMDAAL